MLLCLEKNITYHKTPQQNVKLEKLKQPSVIQQSPKMQGYTTTSQKQEKSHFSEGPDKNRNTWTRKLAGLSGYLDWFGNGTRPKQTNQGLFSSLNMLPVTHVLRGYFLEGEKPFDSTRMEINYSYLISNIISGKIQVLMVR